MHQNPEKVTLSSYQRNWQRAKKYSHWRQNLQILLLGIDVI